MKKLFTVLVIVGFIVGLVYPSFAATKTQSDLTSIAQQQTDGSYAVKGMKSTKTFKPAFSRPVGSEPKNTKIRQTPTRPESVQVNYKAVGNSALTQPIVTKQAKSTGAVKTPAVAIPKVVSGKK